MLINHLMYTTSINSPTPESSGEMTLDFLISGRDTSEVEHFINIRILPLFKDIKHSTFPKEKFDDLYENYMKQIPQRYSKLISRRFFLRCLILG